MAEIKQDYIMFILGGPPAVVRDNVPGFIGKRAAGRTAAAAVAGELVLHVFGREITKATLEIMPDDGAAAAGAVSPAAAGRQAPAAGSPAGRQAPFSAAAKEEQQVGCPELNEGFID